METRINVAELLKDSPSGMELNSVMFENLYFDCIDDSLENDPFPICCYYVNDNEARNRVRFSKYGTYLYLSNDKCVIFPKGKDSWEGFVPPVEFKDGDIVATNSGAWIGIMEKEEHDGKVMSVYCVLKGSAGLEIYHKGKGKWCFSRLATEEEKQRLFKAIEDNGYKWNAEKKCLEKLREPKFKDGDIVATMNGGWIGITKGGEYDCNQPTYCVIRSDGNFEAYKGDEKYSFWAFDRLASEEEKERLFRAIKDNGYKWDVETKSLKKLFKPKFKVGDKVRVKNGVSKYRIIDGVFDNFYSLQSFGRIDFTEQDRWELVPDKFDINTLKPFESRVLVRDYENLKWLPAIWGLSVDDSKEYKYAVEGGNRFNMCIPFEGNEHLCGTSEDCDEFYKTWEE